MTIRNEERHQEWGWTQDDEAEEFRIVDEDDRTIATIYHGSDHIEWWRQRARLIATAPDLLAVLMIIDKVLTTPECPIDELIPRTIRVVRKAIAMTADDGGMVNDN
jgi:hypothetical protein